MIFENDKYKSRKHNFFNKNIKKRITMQNQCKNDGKVLYFGEWNMLRESNENR